MANSFSYDHPHYIIRRFHDGVTTLGTTTGAATCPHISAFAEQLWNAHYKVVTAGTGTSAAYRIINVTSALATTTIATTTVGTSVAGTVVTMNSLTATTNTGVSLAAGSTTSVVPLADETLVARVVWEVQVPPSAVVTAYPG